MRSMTLPKLDNWWWCDIFDGFFSPFFESLLFREEKRTAKQKNVFFHHLVWNCIRTHWVPIARFAQCESVGEKLLELGQLCVLQKWWKKSESREQRKEKKNGLAHFVNEFYIITLLWHNGPHKQHTQAKNYRSVVFFIAFLLYLCVYACGYTEVKERVKIPCCE